MRDSIRNVMKAIVKSTDLLASVSGRRNGQLAERPQTECNEDNSPFMPVKFRQHDRVKTTKARRNRRFVAYVGLTVLVIFASFTWLYYYAISVLNSALSFESFHP